METGPGGWLVVAGGLKRNETRTPGSAVLYCQSGLSVRGRRSPVSLWSGDWLVWSDWICLSYEDEEEEENKM